MIFINTASETICHMIRAFDLNAKGMRDAELTEIAIRMEGETDGLFMALAACEHCSMTAAKGIYHVWWNEKIYEGE